MKNDEGKWRGEGESIVSIKLIKHERKLLHSNTFIERGNNMFITLNVLMLRVKVAVTSKK
jgi:hypothetical protein